MHKISSKSELWNLQFHKNQGFQKINDRNWAYDNLTGWCMLENDLLRIERSQYKKGEKTFFGCNKVAPGMVNCPHACVALIRQLFMGFKNP